jgi:hypothetical protein
MRKEMPWHEQLPVIVFVFVVGGGAGRRVECAANDQNGLREKEGGSIGESTLYTSSSSSFVRDIIHDDDKRKKERKKEIEKEGRSGWRRGAQRHGKGEEEGGTFHPADDGERGRPLFGATTDSGHGGNIREWDEKGGRRIYNKTASTVTAARGGREREKPTPTTYFYFFLFFFF